MAAKKGTKGTKILIAEDEEGLRELYKLRFELESFDVSFAKDGEEAMEKAKEEKPDLVLLDIMMPKKSGIKVLQEMRKNPTTKKIPVVILSVLSEDNFKTKAKKLGANAYLVKADIMASDVVTKTKQILNEK